MMDLLAAQFKSLVLHQWFRHRYIIHLLKMWILPQIVLCERVVAIQSYDFTEMVQMIEY
jgi:hypothetical protein